MFYAKFYDFCGNIRFIFKIPVNLPRPGYQYSNKFPTLVIYFNQSCGRQLMPLFAVFVPPFYVFGNEKDTSKSDGFADFFEPFRPLICGVTSQDSGFVSFAIGIPAIPSVSNQ